MIKVRCIQNCNTVSPEKKWSTGEVKALPDKLALDLLSTPYFEEVKPERKIVFTSKIRRKK